LDPRKTVVDAILIRGSVAVACGLLVATGPGGRWSIGPLSPTHHGWRAAMAKRREARYVDGEAVIPIPKSPLGHARSPALHARNQGPSRVVLHQTDLRRCAAAYHLGCPRLTQPASGGHQRRGKPCSDHVWRAESRRRAASGCRSGPVSAGKRREKVVDAIISIFAGLIRRRPGRQPSRQ
jgi:hypothetical protein